MAIAGFLTELIQIAARTGSDESGQPEYGSYRTVKSRTRETGATKTTGRFLLVSVPATETVSPGDRVIFTLEGVSYTLDVISVRGIGDPVAWQNLDCAEKH